MHLTARCRPCVAPGHRGRAWGPAPGQYVRTCTGAGIRLAEFQEPTDFSVVAEHKGLPIRPEDAHLGVGWEVMLDCFDRDGVTLKPDALAVGRGRASPRVAWYCLLRSGAVES